MLWGAADARRAGKSQLAAWVLLAAQKEPAGQASCCAAEGQ